MLKHLALASLVPLSLAGAHVAGALGAAESTCASGSVSVAVNDAIPLVSAGARLDGHAEDLTCPSSDAGEEDTSGDDAQQGSAEEPAEQPEQGSAEERAEEGEGGSAEPAVTFDADITVQASVSELVDDARSREREVEDQVRQGVSDTCERVARERARDRDAFVGQRDAHAAGLDAGAEVQLARDTTIEQACSTSG